MASGSARDVSLMGRGDSEWEGKARLPVADAAIESKPDELPVGSLVRVIQAKDPWLRQYSGMRARVRQHDGLIVEIVLSCGQLMSFWRDEGEPLSATTDRWAHEES